MKEHFVPWVTTGETKKPYTERQHTTYRKPAWGAVSLETSRLMVDIQKGPHTHPLCKRLHVVCVIMRDSDMRQCLNNIPKVRQIWKVNNIIFKQRMY